MYFPVAPIQYVSMWGEATYQIMREDGMAFSDPTGTIVYEPKAAATATNGSAPAPAPGKTASAAASVVAPEAMLTAVFLAAMAIN
jgi:hypothetical protein